MFWDPSPVILRLPFIHHPVTWYGVLFALGVWLGYQVFFHSTGKDKAYSERLALYVILGTVIGARLGHVLFYEPWNVIAADPLSVIRIWEGGLASHGGVVGILMSLWLFCKRTKTQIVPLIDQLAIPACIAAACIRLGNFVNQEILGKITTLPWAITFGHPADGSWPMPRHPVQLYEALFYAILGIVLLKAKRRGAWMLISIFSFRFFIEFLKEAQSAYIGAGSFFTMGQWLSIPLILASLFMIRQRSSLNHS